MVTIGDAVEPSTWSIKHVHSLLTHPTAYVCPSPWPSQLVTWQSVLLLHVSDWTEAAKYKYSTCCNIQFITVHFQNAYGEARNHQNSHGGYVDQWPVREHPFNLKGGSYGFFRVKIFCFASQRSRIFFRDILFFFYKNNILHWYFK